MMDLRSLFQNADRSQIEDYCRKNAQQAYVGDNVAIARVLGKFLMYVDTRDLSLTPHLLMNGFWEMWVTQAIASYVKPGMRCIDVGANHGYYTLLLSELAGDKGEVIAYEPQARLVSLLNRSTVVNGFTRATVFESACSDSSRNMQLQRHDQFFGSAHLIYDAAKLDERGAPVARDLWVRARRIDEDSLRSWDFVKIDAQGHELQVLRGMRGTIEKSEKIAIAMEFTPSEHPDPAAAVEEILSYGLSLRAIGTDGVVRSISPADAAKPDTGDHRMLWLQKSG